MPDIAMTGREELREAAQIEGVLNAYRRAVRKRVDAGWADADLPMLIELEEREIEEGKKLIAALTAGQSGAGDGANRYGAGDVMPTVEVDPSMFEPGTDAWIAAVATAPPAPAADLGAQHTDLMADFGQYVVCLMHLTSTDPFIDFEKRYDAFLEIEEKQNNEATEIVNPPSTLEHEGNVVRKAARIDAFKEAIQAVEKVPDKFRRTKLITGSKDLTSGGMEYIVPDWTAEFYVKAEKADFVQAIKAALAAERGGTE